jgi:Predicted GTPase
MKEHKIIITGTVGAGKTTAIGAVSEIDPVVTDVVNSDKSIAKELTTVGFDYGEIRLNANERLRLYGTPGQERFDFMWKVLAQGALGVIILVDHASTNATADLDMYIANFKELIQRTGCVIGISKHNERPDVSLDIYSETMEKYQIICPVVSVDVRVKEQVLWMLELLLTQLEMKA